MSIHRCWIVGYEDEEDAVEIDVMDVDYAASKACEHWESHGRWSGDPMPDDIKVRVRTEDGKLFDVSVDTHYSVDFYANAPVAVKL